MAELQLALAASSREWADLLHRFLVDHGGARVRTVVMGAEEAVTESYDVLVIDDVCSFLTPRLVDQVRRTGRLVVGVFEAEDGSDAKRRLLECGVDDVVEAGATPDEFLEVVGRVRQLAPSVAQEPAPARSDTRIGSLVVVGSPPGGCGATEVALALAAELRAVLVDADDVAPSLAQRVGAPLHPNLRTAIDVVYQRSGDVSDFVISSAGVALVGGLAHSDDWAQLHPGEVEAVVAELRGQWSRVVVNVGGGLERPQLGEGRFGLTRSLVAAADLIVAVGLPQPVSMTRLARWMQEAQVLAPDAHHLAVLNRAGRSTFRRGEAQSELGQALQGVEVAMLPEDPRVGEAAWAGTSVRRGPFRRAVRKLAERLPA